MTDDEPPHGARGNTVALAPERLMRLQPAKDGPGIRPETRHPVAQVQILYSSIRSDIWQPFMAHTLTAPSLHEACKTRAHIDAQRLDCATRLRLHVAGTVANGSSRTVRHLKQI